MNEIGRREFLAGASAAAALAASGQAAAQTPKRGGTLRYVPIGDLKILDPIWTTAYITRDHGYMVYDTLFAADANLRIQPQMVEKYSASRDQMKWSFTLRDGLQFHDGQPVTAEDCVASLQRWGKKDPLGKLMLAATGKLAATDRKTFVLELKQPFGLVLDALGKPSSNVPFIMPARFAAISEAEQVKDPIGSGPYRFVKDEWRPGHQVVYERNPSYVPRSEPPSGAAGGKHVYLDRVVWRYMPDPATAAAALEAGELDYWASSPIDYVARYEKSPNLTVFVADALGLVGWVRPNHLHPPFNNKKARQALLWMVNQETYLQAAIGQPKYYRTCPGIFMCGGVPYESAAGAPPRQDLERARQLLKESGYDGHPLVVLDPTDRPELHAAALVTRELLTQIGATVDLQAMDWSTLLARRAKKEPPSQGGWNVFSTNWIAADVMTPAVNAGIAGTCDKAWFGWYCSEKMEALRADWVRATDPARRKQLAEQIQLLAFDEAPFAPWGQYVQPQVFAKKVRGTLKFVTPVMWNVWLEG
ncbi:MAG: ABC transporter substrate-binding protein [Candidatus Rokuibacteriota bacterium]|nr:MAG: ABC transporter substrate-binding protein [Candidatus Rokubacteria bacterium]